MFFYLYALQKYRMSGYIKAHPKALECAEDIMAHVTQEEIFLMDLRSILKLRFEQYASPVASQEVFEHIAKLEGAFYQWDGSPERAHPVLHSGKHSNLFCDTNRVLRHPQLLELFAYTLTTRIRQEVDLREVPAWMTGSDYSAITLSQRVAYHLGCLNHGTTEKEDGKQVWKRGEILEGEKIGHVEELISTCATAAEVREGMREAHRGKNLDFQFLATLVHRSAEEEFEGKRIVRAFHYDAPVWKPEDCEACKVGSRAVVRPKFNWDELLRIAA